MFPMTLMMSISFACQYIQTAQFAYWIAQGLSSFKLSNLVKDLYWAILFPCVFIADLTFAVYARVLRKKNIKKFTYSNSACLHRQNQLAHVDKAPAILLD